MASLKKIKRRALQGAVRQNIELIQGRLPTAPRRRGLGLALASARLFFFVAVPVALFASSYVLATVADGWWTEADRGPDPEALERAFQQARRAAARAVGAGQMAPSPPMDASLVAARPLDPAVFPLTMRKIVLDPGHGGDNLGTVSGSLLEKELTLDIARRLRALLEERSFEVEMTRESDESLSLEERALFANRMRGDIFISIHVNWLATRQVRGVETFFLGPTDDPRLNELAARENMGSGYSLADLRLVIEQVYAQARQGESRRLASEVQRALFRSLGKLGPGLQDRGVKTAPFGVLIRTEMPAILAEVSCLSNEKEARLLATADYRQYIAEALFAGVESYSKVLNQGNRIGG